MDKHVVLKEKSEELKNFNEAKGLLHIKNPHSNRITDDKVVSEACKSFVEANSNGKTRQ